jgi:uncharacterized protein involved in exopolysaccharide biosynthesis
MSAPAQTREQLHADIIAQLLNQNVNTLAASLADVTIQLRETKARIAELEEQLSPKPKDE